MLGWLLHGMARVSAYTVHEPPQVGGSRIDRAESIVLIGEGFSWRTAIFGPFHLLVGGQWMALAIYVAAAIVTSAILAAAGAGNQWYTVVFLVLNVIAGFEASELKRWSLGRAGWQEIATVSGHGREDAERRFFDLWLPSIADVTPGERHLGASPGADGDTTSRVEASIRRLSERLRSKFALKS